MKFETVQSVIASALALQLGLGSLLAASPAIGTVMAKGSFRLDAATVNNNATLFEGSVLETQQAGSTVALNSGARLSLAAASRGKLFGNRLVLEKGESRFEKGSGFQLEALGLRIEPQTAASEGSVTLSAANRVQVAANKGSFRVLNSQGVLVANVNTGSALALEPSRNVTDSSLTGTPRSRNGRVLVTDETTNVTVEIAGPGLANEIGRRVRLSGSVDPSTTPAPEAAQFVRVTQIARLNDQPSSKRGDSSDSAKGQGQTAPAGVGGNNSKKKGAPISLTTGAVIGGVAAAAVLGGFAAAEKLPGQGGQGDASASR